MEVASRWASENPSGALHLIVYVTRSKQSGHSIYEVFHGCWADAPYPRQHALGPAIIGPFIAQDFGKDSLNFKLNLQLWTSTWLRR